MLLSFYHWSVMLVVGCHIRLFAILKYVSLYILFETFNQKLMLNFSNILLHLSDDHTMFILYFANVVYHGVLLMDVNYFCIPGMNPMLNGVYFQCIELCLLTFCWVFLHFVHQEYLPIVFFLVYVMSLPGFIIRVLLTS